MRVVYVVTESDGGPYSQMARVSVAALRRLHPDWIATVVCDRQHEALQEDGPRSLAQEVDEYVPVDTPGATPVDRSRWLKTTLRKKLDGEFLFLDCDAIPVSPMGDVARSRGDVSMALDLNLTASQYRLHPRIRDVHQQLGWREPRRYFNSGVMLWRDTAAARKLSEAWHVHWQASREIGCTQDQPGLNVAIESTGCEVSELPAKWNAMVERENWGRCRPVVLHFLKWCGSDATVLAQLVRGLKETGRIEANVFDRLLKTGYPWLNEESFSRQRACGRMGAAAGVAWRRGLAFLGRSFRQSYGRQTTEAGHERNPENVVP